MGCSVRFAEKEKAPIPAIIAGTRAYRLLRCHPAWCVSTPTHAYWHMPDFVNGGPLRLTYWFQLALRSPFLSALCTALPPPAALCDMELRKYLLFLIGFNTAIICTPVGKVKRVWEKITHSRKNCWQFKNFVVQSECIWGTSRFLECEDNSSSPCTLPLMEGCVLF